MNKVLLDAYEVCRKKVDMYMERYNGEVYWFTERCYTGDYYKDSEHISFKDRPGWLASFITGLGPLMYKAEKEEKYLEWAKQFKDDYRAVAFQEPVKAAHDIGFLYSIYCVAMYQVTGEREYREIALKAADELAKRFHINARVIQAWGSMYSHNEPCRIIVDTMMNLPLLFWAWKETGHRFYRDIAKTHAETAKKLLVREDFSVCHAFIFDEDSGEILREANTCGYDDGSHWARGTGWAIYGFAIAARYLEDEEYFTLATKIAEKYIASMPVGEYVPVWDFRLPKELPAKIYGATFLPPERRLKASWDESKKENCVFNVDTSACAIVACGLIELNKYRMNEAFSEYIDKSLEELCQNYLNADMQIQGMIKRQNGCDTYTLYGDYFFAEALMSRVFQTDVPW